MSLTLTVSKDDQKFYRFGPWQILYKVTRVVCSDGITRVFRPHGQSDTVWTQPGCVQVKGKTVWGHLYFSDKYQVWMFAAYTYRRNGNLLPPLDN